MLVASYFMAEIEGIISIKLLWLFTGNILDKYRNRAISNLRQPLFLY